MRSSRALAQLAAVGTLLCAGCSYSSYAGVGFAPGQAPPDLARLAHKASRGNLAARYQLGLLYEGGQGVVRNVVCAARLYEAAASGPNGLPEARARLEAIRPLVEQEENPEAVGEWCGRMS